MDVLISLEENSGVSLFDWVEMIKEPKEVFGRYVDLVSTGGLRNPYRREELMSTRQVIYARWAGRCCLHLGK